VPVAEPALYMVRAPGKTGRSSICLILLAVALTPIADAASSDPGRWERRAQAGVVRSEVAAAVVGDRIYVVGGLTGAGPTDAVEEYDPATDRWRARAALPQRVHHPAAASWNGRLYVIGGFVAQGLSIWHSIAAVSEYDPATDRWRARAAMPTARGALVSVAMGDRIFAVGGTNGTDTGALEAYDPRADAWTALRPMPTPRNHIAAVVMGGKIYVFGGRAARVRGNLAATEVYDPAADRWETRAPMVTPRSGIGAAVVMGKAYVMGGELGRPDTYPENEEYDPASNAWTPRADMPTPRHGLGVVTFGERIFALSGGPHPGGTFSNVNEAYIPPR
jgi:N-acetylneuraminic acid mutarotase